MLRDPATGRHVGSLNYTLQPGWAGQEDASDTCNANGIAQLESPQAAVTHQRTHSQVRLDIPGSCPAAYSRFGHVESASTYTECLSGCQAPHAEVVAGTSQEGPPSHSNLHAATPIRLLKVPCVPSRWPLAREHEMCAKGRLQKTECDLSDHPHGREQRRRPPQPPIPSPQPRQRANR